MIVDLTDILSFLDVDVGYFIVNASHDVLVLAYDGGSATSVGVDDGTYNGTELAAELESKIDTAFTITSTVSYMAKINNRKYIGIDISEEYCDIARRRIKAIPGLLF